MRCNRVCLQCETFIVQTHFSIFKAVLQHIVIQIVYEFDLMEKVGNW